MFSFNFQKIKSILFREIKLHFATVSFTEPEQTMKKLHVVTLWSLNSAVNCQKDFTWTAQLTDFKEQSPYWETNSCSRRKEIFRLLWNPKIRARFRNKQPLAPPRATWMHPHPHTLAM
jgi:hypothetical protein